jgi:hypothetical protein
MKRSTGEKAWACLGLVIVVYEIVAPDNELLSEVVDRFLVSHPIVTRTIVIGLALHLINLLPEQIDPLHHTAIAVRKYRSRSSYGPSQLGKLGRGYRGKPEVDRG